METVAKISQGICLTGKYVSVNGIHAENSNCTYWFAHEKGDPDMVSEEHMELLRVQKPGEASNHFFARLSISGPGLMSLPDSIARQALKKVLTKDYESEYNLLFIRDLRSASAIADFFRIFVRDFGPSSAAVGSNCYCASVDVIFLEFSFHGTPKAWEALVLYLFNKDCWHFYQGIDSIDVSCSMKLVPPESVARMGGGIAQAIGGSTMRELSFSKCDCGSSPGSILPFLHNLILGASESGGRIRDLCIHRSFLSDDDGAKILASLSSCALFENLERLYVHCKATAEKTSDALGEFLSSRRCPIQKLDLFCNYHGCDVQRKALLHVSRIFHGLSRNTSLKHVRLEFPYDEDVVQDDVAIQFGLALRLNRTLESVELEHFLMSDKGAAILADAIVETCLPFALSGMYRNPEAMIQHAEVWERCLQCNPYLRRLVGPPFFGLVGPVDGRLLSVMYLLCLNRAGRRFFFLPTPARSSKRRKISKGHDPRLPLALWPLLMARVLKKDIVDPYSRALGICPADMIYRMLQDGPIIHEW